MLQNGSRKVARSLDVVQLIKTVQYQQVALKALLSTKARQLLKNQHEFTMLDFRDMTCTSSEESNRENHLKSEQSLMTHWTDWKPASRAEQVLLSGLL